MSVRYFWPSDDEQLAGQWQDTHFDEDAGWWVSVQQCGTTLALAAALVVSAATTTAASQVFSQSQDDPAGNLTSQVAVQEEYAQPLVPPYNWPQPSVFTDDDIHVQFVQTFTPDDGDYQSLVPPVQVTNYVSLPFVELDQLPQFPAFTPAFDDTAAVGPLTIPPDPNWTLLFFLDDGSAVHVFEADEDFLSAQALPAPYNWEQPRQPFAIEDEQVPQFPAEDDFWPVYVQPDPGSLLWPQPWTFEQNESTNLVAFTTEEYGWPIPVPVADSIWLLRQDAFEQHDATGSLTLTLDDSFQPLVIPGVPLPDPGNLRLLQQWPFEQNEPAGSLRNNVDEDYWINWVRPENWLHPQAVTYDDFLGFPPATATNEEYFSWLVAAVPDSLKGLYGSSIYLPDVEEIPAGSLVPFIPPPPLFCPLPPVGPDSDTSMSVFGGRQQPTLALFCRICNSGKPLVVRADYAIWCQDCCAFVSKSDTYMGTVQSPGAFKSIF